MRPELTATLDGERAGGGRRRRPDGLARPGPQPHHARHRGLHPGRAGHGDPGPRPRCHRGRAAAPAPARPPSRCTGPPTCSTRTGGATRAASWWSARPPLLVAYTEGVLPSLGEEGQVAIRAVGCAGGRREADAYDEPAGGQDQGLRADAPGAAPGRPRRAGPGGGGARPSCGWSPSAAGWSWTAAELGGIRQTVLGGTAPLNLMRPRARRLLLDALWAKSGRGRHLLDPRADRRGAGVVRRGRLRRGRRSWPSWTPGGRCSRRAGCSRRCADERRLGRWARRVLQPARGAPAGPLPAPAGPPGGGPLSVHDVALLDELQLLLGAPARPRRPRGGRSARPADRPGGGDHLRRPRLPPSARGAPGAERTEYAHVIVDEAQDLTPMQWRMIGRRGPDGHLDDRRRPGAELLDRPGGGAGRAGRGAGRASRAAASR